MNKFDVEYYRTKSDEGNLKLSEEIKQWFKTDNNALLDLQKRLDEAAEQGSYELYFNVYPYSKQWENFDHKVVCQYLIFELLEYLLDFKTGFSTETISIHWNHKNK